ncbi:hypothetical protein SUGI_0980460 [Cryptomeria japonica]|nr:hypothetical protein SUGI_0980460 [Cryptomeria japonica]
MEASLKEKNGLSFQKEGKALFFAGRISWFFAGFAGLEKLVYFVQLNRILGREGFWFEIFVQGFSGKNFEGFFSSTVDFR